MRPAGRPAGQRAGGGDGDAVHPVRGPAGHRRRRTRSTGCASRARPRSSPRCARTAPRRWCTELRGWPGLGAAFRAAASRHGGQALVAEPAGPLLLGSGPAGAAARQPSRAAGRPGPGCAPGPGRAGRCPAPGPRRRPRCRRRCPHPTDDPGQRPGPRPDVVTPWWFSNPVSVGTPSAGSTSARISPTPRRSPRPLRMSRISRPRTGWPSSPPNSVAEQLIAGAHGEHHRPRLRPRRPARRPARSRRAASTCGRSSPPPSR